MKIKLLGYSETSFLSKEGVRVEGTSLFYSYPTLNPEVVGEECEKKFIGKGTVTLPALKVGGGYDMEYSNKGKLLAMLDIPSKSKGE